MVDPVQLDVTIKRLSESLLVATIDINDVDPILGMWIVVRLPNRALC